MMRRFCGDNKPALLLLALIYFAYVFSFVVASPMSLGLDLICAAVNSASLGIASLLFYRLVIPKILMSPPRTRLIAHALAAVLFTLAWYWILIISLGALFDRNVARFSVSPFFGRAAVWQITQGLTFYALLAVFARIETEGRHFAEQAPNGGAGQVPMPPALFFRDNDIIRPLDPDRILFLRGADDYVEATTLTGTHLLRASLTQLGERLGPAFLRVHRSWLVNSHHIACAEPAGDGRMLLQMDNGMLITTSRAGARLLRHHLV